jgi:hypothetical protein
VCLRCLCVASGLGLWEWLRLVRKLHVILGCDPRFVILTRDSMCQAFAQRRNVSFSADDSFVGSVKSLKAAAAPVTR